MSRTSQQLKSEAIHLAPGDLTDLTSRLRTSTTPRAVVKTPEAKGFARRVSVIGNAPPAPTPAARVIAKIEAKP